MSRVLDDPQLDLVAEDDDQRSQAQGEQGDGDEDNGPGAAAPEGPVFRRQMIGAAETFHEREHDAEAGKQAKACCRKDKRAGAEVMGEDRRLHQVECVRREKLFENGACFAHEGGSRFNLRYQSGDHEQCGEEHEHSGVGDCLGRIDNVVGQSLQQGFSEFVQVLRHARPWPEYCMKRVRGEKCLQNRVLRGGERQGWRRF
jgi:hypothetical protein